MEILSNYDMDSVFLVAAIVIDRLIGDPAWMPHPIRWIGRLINTLEALLLNRSSTSSRGGKKIAGALTVIIVAGSVYVFTFALLYLSYQASPLLFTGLSIYIIWASISIKSLGGEARAVVTALEAHGLGAARLRLARIVGRDTVNLSEEEVLRAAAETVAENTSDGIIAPLFYLAIGGPPLMLSYKAINTLDSMIGYKNEQYKDFGLVAARTDDIANYLPARLTAALMVVVSVILRYDFFGALRTVIRDGGKHPSPNAGVVEAAAAGALQTRFGGPTSYRGIISDKPFIGTGSRTADKSMLLKSIRLMEGSALLMLLGLVIFQSFI